MPCLGQTNLCSELIVNRQPGCMAWVLQAAANEGDKLPGAARQACFRLAPGTHTLGRKGTAIVLLGDDSISRTHAQATVPDGDSNSIHITGDIRHVASLDRCIC